MSIEGNDAAAILAKLVEAEERRANMLNRPRTISCKNYVIGQNFPSFLSHFKECVKAAYGFVLTDDTVRQQFIDACLLWLPSKLEPGATAETYERRADNVKEDWDQLIIELTRAFTDDTDKEVFLAHPAAFQQKELPLLEYKHEMLRKMATYQPELDSSSLEFQRQATSRFIEGLADAKLKKKLRKYCKRDKMTVDDAYHFTIDYQTAELQTRINDGEVKELGAAAPASASAEHNELLDSSDESADEVIESQMGKEIQEIRVRQEETNGRIDTLCKEFGILAVNMKTMERGITAQLDRIETLLLYNHQMQGFAMGGPTVLPNESNGAYSFQ